MRVFVLVVGVLAFGVTLWWATRGQEPRRLVAPIGEAPATAPATARPTPPAPNPLPGTADVTAAEGIARAFAVAFAGGSPPAAFAGLATPALLNALRTPAATPPRDRGAQVTIRSVVVDDLAPGGIGLAVTVDTGLTIDELLTATPDGWRVAEILM